MDYDYEAAKNELRRRLITLCRCRGALPGWVRGIGIGPEGLELRTARIGSGTKADIPTTILLPGTTLLIPVHVIEIGEVVLQVESTSAVELADVLVKTGSEQLTENQLAWLNSRLEYLTFSTADAGTNPGRLRAAAPGLGSALAQYETVEQGVEALIGVSVRAGVEPGDRAAPDLVKLKTAKKSRRKPRVIIGGVNPVVGWVPGLGPSDADIAAYVNLRADWEAFERAGVGSTILLNLREILLDWRGFRDEYETNADSWTGSTNNEFTGSLNAQIIKANMVRRYLAEYKAPAGKAAPVFTKQDITNIDVEADHPTSTSVNNWAQQHTAVDVLTKPSGPDPVQAVLSSINPFARPPGHPFWSPQNIGPLLWAAGGVVAAWVAYRVVVDIVVPVAAPLAASMHTGAAV